VAHLALILARRAPRDSATVAAMGLLKSITWATAGFATAHVLESAWHRWIAHGKRPDPTRTGHLEHHRIAAEPVDVPAELREHAARFAKTLLGVNVVLAPLLGLRRALPFSVGLTAGLVAVSYYHARMHRRAPRGRYEEWMWRFHWHHHAVDARVNFGLTNPLLDFVFGTAVAPSEVELHPKTCTSIVARWLSVLPMA
jgi:sterol desaturase/sphingolipid hydroxylase (fatty acid hydroxylase superfamily)